MRYNLAVTSVAECELAECASWWSKYRSASQAAERLEKIEAAIDKLRDDPERRRPARESAKFPFVLREQLFGIGKRPTHRILFEVAEHQVTVLFVRHLAQDDVSPDTTPDEIS